MKIKNYLLVFLLLCTFKSFAGGMSAWQKESPYGHNLEHDGTAGGWVCMNVDTTTLCFQSFYFYKATPLPMAIASILSLMKRKKLLGNLPTSLAGVLQ